MIIVASSLPPLLFKCFSALLLHQTIFYFPIISECMSAHCLLHRYYILIIEIIDSLTLNQKWVWNDFNHAPTYILCHNGSWISDGSNIILLNIEGTQTCTSIDDPTRSYYFWLRMNGHQTSTIIGIWLDLMNKQSAQSQTSFFPGVGNVENEVI